MTEAKTAKAAPKAAKKATVADDSKFADRLTEGAREFVKRSVATAQERTEGAYDASKRYTSNVEGFLVRAARGYADILGNVADATYTNMNHSIATAEKLAEAKTLSDAMQIQMDFVRESSSRNMETMRSAYDFVREGVTEASAELRDTATKAWSGEKAA
ncbi:MAG: phasin family protein [Marinovum sp.]|nr:phasin family protein [Marinovum sp.]